jgi:transposase InsO family protein
MRIREIAQARPRFGYLRIWIMLRREGWPDNKKRIHRLYRLEGLQVRMRARRKKRLSLHRGIVPPANGRDQAWSMDVVHDQLITGRAFRVLTVIDQWSRESVLMEANVALTGQSVVEALEALAARRPLPKRSRSITALSSHRRPSMNGRTVVASRSTSFGPASRWRTRSLRVSTVGCGTSASTRIASCRSPMPSR